MTEHWPCTHEPQVVGGAGLPQSGRGLPEADRAAARDAARGEVAGSSPAPGLTHHPRQPCSTGYICPSCRAWYAADPAGSDAWWFRCECGELAGPALASEVAAQQLGLEIA